MTKLTSILYSIIFLIIGISVKGQINLDYQKPHENILKLVDAPLPPRLNMNTEGTQALLLYRNAYKSIEELSQPEMRLAGLRINPKTNINSRQRYDFDVAVLDVVNNKVLQVSGMPPDGLFTYYRWSPDETKVALTHTASEGVELWVVDLKSTTAKRIIGPHINANMGSPYEWLDDSSLIVKLLPDNRQPLIDVEASIPKGPVISVNAGKKAQNRTYQDLLKSPADEKNFELLAESTLVKVDLDGNITPWMSADMYRSLEISPDRQYVLLNIVERPYSYLVPYYRFPTKTVIYKSDGTLVKVFQELPLIEDLPKGFMATHRFKREIDWRSDKPASLYWVEAMDGGDPQIESEYRDAIYSQAAPFNGSVEYLGKTHNRFSYANWGNDETAIIHDRWFNNRNTKSYLINPGHPELDPMILTDRNYQDRYSDPGYFVTRKNEWGKEVLEIQDGHLYMIGPGYSDEGVHPFVDQMNLESGDKKRIYQSAIPDKYERIRSSIDIKTGRILVSIESPNEFPNYYIRNINSNELTAITNFDNPFATIQNVQKELVRYKRDDGVDLTGTLYLPSDYDKSSGVKLPMLLWAYPVEYKDKSSAGQITSSPYQFTYPSYGSPIFWVARGYVVLDRAAFPIVGEGDQEPNDSFVKQLVANAEAAINAIDEMGYIDRNRVGVGGHSYGAFMTANLLSHSDLFAAGIARSGAYNRTLTPFGFQREERTYWDDPSIYYNMSPFMHADKMKTPLLLIHGKADNNSGTYPMQSERYFNALKGLGATVRLVMLPKESHGYAARESILHMLWEQDQWLERYVKHKGEQEMQP